jgi:hypothetical protein
MVEALGTYRGFKPRFGVCSGRLGGFSFDGRHDNFSLLNGGKSISRNNSPGRNHQAFKDIEFDGGQVDKFFAGQTCRDRDFSLTPPDSIIVSSDKSLLSVRLKTALIPASNSSGANGFGR